MDDRFYDVLKDKGVKISQNDMKQREKLKKLLIEFCNTRDSRTFSLNQLYDYLNDYPIDIGGNTPQATVRRLLQELRDENFLSFLIEKGNYTLRGIDLLDAEKKDLENIIIKKEEDPNKKEYLRETYIRNTKLVLEAKEKFGYKCFIHQCKNEFLTPKNIPYIEVHHIIPLFKGGEDALWNLATLCAHHHKMAHFAEEKTVNCLENKLLKINIERL